MRKYSHKDYHDAVSELVEVIAKHHGEQVKAVYAGGSFARGDFVPGRSDVDLYVVVKGEKEELQEALHNKALEIERRHFNNLRAALDEVLGVTVTTLKEVEEGNSFLAMGFEYANFIKDGKLLWGDDIKLLIPKPAAEKQKQTAKNSLNKVFLLVSRLERNLKWLKSVPFRLVPRKSKERWTRQAFELTFRTGALFLGCKGIYVSAKEDIASAFKATMHNEEELCRIISYALSLWEKWKTEPLDDRETKELLENSGKFVKKIQSLQTSP